MRRGMLALALAGLASAAVGVAPGAAGATPAEAEGEALRPAVSVRELPGLGGAVRPYDINDRGVVVGTSGTTSPVVVHALRWGRAGLTDLTPEAGPPAPYGATFGLAASVNERGQVAGALASGPLPPVSDALTWVGDERVNLSEGTDAFEMGWAVNDRGDVLVNRGWSSGPRQALVWRDGAVRESPPALGGNGLNATAMNGSGVVVGEAGAGEGQRAHVWRPGAEPAALPGLSDGPSAAAAVNDRGQVAGSATDAAGRLRAVRWAADGTPRDLGTLGGATAEVAPGPPGGGSAINARGDVVGRSETADGEQHAFLWRDGRMIDLGTLGGTESQAIAVNDRGQVVGTSRLAGGGSTRAFLWQEGHMVDLGAVAGVDFSSPVDINDRGEVIGEGGAPGGPSRAFVWTAPPR